MDRTPVRGEVHDIPELVDLTGRPSCSNCLAWSPDGELAVATGGTVHILTPKQDTAKSPDLPPVTGLRQWHDARIIVNLFTPEEWPYVEHGRFAEFCIGEEQSLSHVIALSWSPESIAIHRRSLLAVLTSNLILSLWETDGGIGRWTRVGIVNHALGKFFHPKNDENDSFRYRKTIRAFSWSPQKAHATNGHDRSHTDTTAPSLAVSSLAVLNSVNEIVILQLEVDTDSLGFRTGYNLDVLTTCKFPHELNFRGSDDASIFQTSLRETFVLEHISWGPWLIQPDSNDSVSLIAALHTEHLRFVEIRDPSARYGVQPNFVSHPQARLVEAASVALDQLEGVHHPPSAWQYLVRAR